ncbi:MAG TPA: tetratricopeptide repeat protein [Urbifossiella sp.]|jgi:tetratricopeptide (TPR) repeat protein
MTQSNTSPAIGQPTLTDLMVRFLATRSDAASAAVEPASGEVEPHEVAAGFRVDPRAAWTDAVAAIQLAADSSPIPSDWGSLVNQPSAMFAVAMAVGNFPQRVKDLHPLLARFEIRELRPSAHPAATTGFSGLHTWLEREAKKGTSPALLLAAGLARTTGDFDRSAQLLADAKPHSLGNLQAVWENEWAALLWHRGQCEEALAAWTAMSASPAVHFNRGMALLFLGQSSEARAAFTQAIAVIPETSGWNALARLYQTVAEIQG